MRLSTLAAPLVAACIGVAPHAAQAQTYPDRPITLIAATAPGGPGDIAARLIGERMTEILGQQFVVENVPGGGGVTGTARLARSAPDGYTLLIHQTGITIQPALHKNLSFDFEKDLTTVGLVNKSYSFLVGRKALPAANMKDLVKWAKESGVAKIAHPGVGSFGHLISVLLARDMGADVSLVPYRGVGPAMNDIAGGHVDLLWAGAVAATPLIKGGTVKGYLSTYEKRSPLIPEIPSAVEFGYTDVTAPFWHALFAPAQTPKPIIEKLNAALQQALKDPRVIKAYAESGVEAYPPEQLGVDASNAYVRSEAEKWTKVVKENKIQPEQ
jgi:tripartite-type tricarboxylate transporter receptor subunit TctC